MNRSSRGAALLLAVLLPPTAVEAGAWNAAPGSLYLKLSYAASSANNQFGFDGTRRPIVDGLTDYPFADRSLYLYLEYGLRSNLTLTASVPMKRIVVHDSQFRYETEGLGDLSGGVRLGLLKKGPWVVSAVSDLQFPTRYHRDARPPLGAGQVDLSLGVEAGRSFYPRPAWGTASLRYRWRSPVYLSVTEPPDPAPGKIDYADALMYGLEVGWTFADRITLKPAVRGAWSFRTDGNAFTLTSLPSTERYLKAGGGASVRIARRYDLSVDLMQTLAGRNSAQSIDLIFGAAVSW